MQGRPRRRCRRTSRPRCAARPGDDRRHREVGARPRAALHHHRRKGRRRRRRLPRLTRVPGGGREAAGEPEQRGPEREPRSIARQSGLDIPVVQLPATQSSPGLQQEQPHWTTSDVAAERHAGAVVAGLAATAGGRAGLARTLAGRALAAARAAAGAAAAVAAAAGAIGGTGRLAAAPAVEDRAALAAAGLAAPVRLASVAAVLRAVGVQQLPAVEHRAARAAAGLPAAVRHPTPAAVGRTVGRAARAHVESCSPSRRRRSRRTRPTCRRCCRPWGRWACSSSRRTAPRRSGSRRSCRSRPTCPRGCRRSDSWACSSAPMYERGPRRAGAGPAAAVRLAAVAAVRGADRACSSCRRTAPRRSRNRRSCRSRPTSRPGCRRRDSWACSSRPSTSCCRSRRGTSRCSRRRRPARLPSAGQLGVQTQLPPDAAAVGAAALAAAVAGVDADAVAADAARRAGHARAQVRDALAAAADLVARRSGRGAGGSAPTQIRVQASPAPHERVAGVELGALAGAAVAVLPGGAGHAVAGLEEAAGDAGAVDAGLPFAQVLPAQGSVTATQVA